MGVTDMRDDYDDADDRSGDRYAVRPPRRRREYDADDYDERPRARRQSGWGMASFFLSLGAGAAAFLMVVIAGVMANQAGGELDEKSPAAMIVGLCLFGCLLLALIGGVFGIIGVAQANRKKTFAILGLVFNAVVGFGLLFIVLLGLAAG